MCVIYTRWGNDKKAKLGRARGNLTEEGRTKEVVEMLNTECPLSKGHMIPVYFTDTLDIDDNL